MTQPGPPSLEPGAEIAGHRIDGVLGRGGMGVVYRATQLSLDRQVALKVITPDLAGDAAFRERFKRESRLAALIEHPHVIPVHEARDADGLLFITMRLIEGTDLQAMIAGGGSLEPRRAATIIAQIGAALDAAHERGLVHRDVKPANVLVAQRDGQDHAYLTDFGLTKNLASESGMTATGTTVGTLDYIAPEQIEGAKLDARADVYALGCVLFHLLTGRVPYPQETQPAKLWAHMSADPPVPSAERPDLPAEMDGVVRRAMAKDPEDRYLSAGDLGRAALAAAQGQRLTRAEHSVATGAAAPAEVSAVPPRDDVTRATPRPEPRGEEAIATEPPAPGPKPARPRSPLVLILAGVGALAAVVIVLLVAGVFGGDDGPSSSEEKAVFTAVRGHFRINPELGEPDGKGSFGSLEIDGNRATVDFFILDGTSKRVALRRAGDDQWRVVGVDGGRVGTERGGYTAEDQAIDQTINNWVAQEIPEEACAVVTNAFKERLREREGKSCEAFVRGREPTGVSTRGLRIMEETATLIVIDGTTETKATLVRSGAGWLLDDLGR